MNARQVKALQRHAQRHGLCLVNVTGGKNAVSFKVAQMAICRAAATLIETGDTYATSTELVTGVSITVRRSEI